MMVLRLAIISSVVMKLLPLTVNGLIMRPRRRPKRIEHGGSKIEGRLERYGRDLPSSILDPLRVASWIDFSSQQELLPLTHLAPDKQLPGHSCGYPPMLWPNPSRKKS